MDIVLTIKPNHLRNIRIGKKKWELRKTKPKQIDYFDVPIRVYCCESGSGGNILAEFSCYHIQAIWNSVNDIHVAAEKACISENEVKEYIGDRDLIFAWVVDNVIDYTRDKGHRIRNISEFGIKKVPQSWCYIK